MEFSLAVKPTRLYLKVPFLWAEGSGRMEEDRALQMLSEEASPKVFQPVCLATLRRRKDCKSPVPDVFCLIIVGFRSKSQVWKFQQTFVVAVWSRMSCTERLEVERQFASFYSFRYSLYCYKPKRWFSKKPTFPISMDGVWMSGTTSLSCEGGMVFFPFHWRRTAKSSFYYLVQLS